jgi:hypothetical protein
MYVLDACTLPTLEESRNHVCTIVALTNPPAWVKKHC